MNPFGQQPFFYYPMNERYMGVPGMAYPGRQPMQPLPAQPRALQGWHDGLTLTHLFEKENADGEQNEQEEE